MNLYYMYILLSFFSSELFLIFNAQMATVYDVLIDCHVFYSIVSNYGKSRCATWLQIDFTRPTFYQYINIIPRNTNNALNCV